MSERELSVELHTPSKNTCPWAERGQGSLMENKGSGEVWNDAFRRIPTTKKPNFIQTAVIFEDNQHLYLPLSCLGCVRLGSDILRKSSDTLLRRVEYPMASRPPPLRFFYTRSDWVGDHKHTWGIIHLIWPGNATEWFRRTPKQLQGKRFGGS